MPKANIMGILSRLDAVYRMKRLLPAFIFYSSAFIHPVSPEYPANLSFHIIFPALRYYKMRTPDKKTMLQMLQ